MALPSIRDDLGFSQESLAWVVGAYPLTFGGFLLLEAGWATCSAIAGGVLHRDHGVHARSLACGLATSQAALVAARAVQGIGGVIVSAVVLSLIMPLFVEFAERAKAMGVSASSSPAAVPPAYCWRGDHRPLSWHGIFLVTLRLG